MSEKKKPESNQPFVVETMALTALRFYADNYDQLVFRGLEPQPRPVFLGAKPQTCRFCRKTRPEVTFRHAAHAIPEFVGNKVLFSYYECDTCNDRFSAFEDDLAKMTLGDRAIGQVKGKNKGGNKGYPKLTTKGQKSTIERGPAGLLIKQYLDEGVVATNETDGRLDVKYETQPYRALGAYKCLAKMAYTLLPENELPNFEHLRQWLLQEDVATKKLYGDGNHLCSMSFVPGPLPFRHPVVALLRRKTGVEAPYCVFFLAFGNWSYQIFVPCPAKDAAVLGGKTVKVFLYPHYYQLQPWHAPGLVQVKNFDMSAADRLAEPKSISLHFDKMVLKLPAEPSAG